MGNNHSEPMDAGLEPVSEPPFEESAAGGAEAAQGGIALCLSGGGYRAMLFHVGAIWRINQLGLLSQLARISSVSGGSITAATLGFRWNQLDFVNGIAANLDQTLAEPIRHMARQTIDIWAVGWGILNPFQTVGDQVADAYRDHLYGRATLQDLPDRPRFVINATNVKTGAVWRFSRPYMGDWRTGLVPRPEIPLATAVAASSAFPPFLSPMTIRLRPSQFDSTVAAELTADEFRSEIVLTDGGVYDNLGLEAAFKRFETLLVSDGGRSMVPEPHPASDWARHSYRLIELLQRQTSSLRRRQLIASYQSAKRTGAYWGIQSDIADYEMRDALPAPHGVTLDLANTPTRLAAMDDVLQERLINWGYAVCDAALRRYLPLSHTPPAPAWPYPQSPP